MRTMMFIRRGVVNSFSGSGVPCALRTGLIVTCMAGAGSVAAQSVEPCPPVNSGSTQTAVESESGQQECGPVDTAVVPMLSVSQAFGAVVLHWNDFAGNEYGYEVFRDGLPYHSATSEQTVFVDRLAQDGQSHNYAIWPVIIETDQIRSTIPSEFVYVQNSAWSTLDPADALRTASAQTIVNEMKDIEPDHRPVVMAAIAGTTQTAAAQPASVESADGDTVDAVDTETASQSESVSADTDDTSDDSGTIDEAVTATAVKNIETLTLVEAVLDAETFIDQHDATVLINTFLKQQGSDRQLSSAFTLENFDPNSNFQHRLSTDTFAEIRNALMSLDFSQLEAESVNQSITESIVGILDLAESRGLAGTTAVNVLSGSDNADASVVGQDQPSTSGVETQSSVEVEESSPTDNVAAAETEEQETDQSPAMMLLIDKEGNVRVDRSASDNALAQSQKTESPAEKLNSLRNRMDDIGKRMVLIGKSSERQSYSADSDSTTGDTRETTGSTTETETETETVRSEPVATMELDQGAAPAASSDSGAVELLDLSVEPGQGFETLPLDQQISSEDLLELDANSNSQKLETLPVRTTQ